MNCLFPYSTGRAKGEKMTNFQVFAANFWQQGGFSQGKPTEWQLAQKKEPPPIWRRLLFCRKNRNRLLRGQHARINRHVRPYDHGSDDAEDKQSGGEVPGQFFNKIG